MTRPQVLADTIQHLEALLKGPGFNKVPFRIESEDDVITAGATSLAEKSVPIFVVSSVTGRGLNLLTKFLNLLPPGWGALEREKMEQEPVEFQIYETFCLPRVGTVLGGLLTQGVLTENMNLLLGPLEDGSFHPVQVQSIQRHKSSCRVVRAGQSASLALNIELPNIRKGMILADPHLKPQATLYFQVRISTRMEKIYKCKIISLNISTVFFFVLCVFRPQLLSSSILLACIRDFKQRSTLVASNKQPYWKESWPPSTSSPTTQLRFFSDFYSIRNLYEPVRDCCSVRAAHKESAKSLRSSRSRSTDRRFKFTAVQNQFNVGIS